MTARFLAAVAVVLLLSGAATAQTSYVHFESGPVRPIVLSDDGTRLFVTNISDNRLEIYFVSQFGALTHLDSVAVGMEPVAVAQNGDDVWVVNHLSDSVSVVDWTADPPVVTRTLLVGDEPRDIVFAGSGDGRAFISTAHRGQHRTDGSISGVSGAGDPQLTTEGIGRADVWVFDAADQGTAFGGEPDEILTFFGDTPRALTTDGSTVWLGVFHSGNQTTTLNEGVVCDGLSGAGSCTVDGGSSPGGNPGPDDNHQGVTAPEVGLIVKFDESSGEWRDEGARDWTDQVRFDLPDEDVFSFDADTLAAINTYTGVGTILFNMAVNPANGKVYVSNGDSQNLTRFEGAGTHGGTTVQGNLAQYGISVLSGASTVDLRHLNKHINYSTLPAPAGTGDHSIATPLEMVFNNAGTKLYVAAFGSNKIGVYDTATLENDTFDPTVQSAQHISVSGGGPSGLALKGAKLFVYNRFSNSISTLNVNTGTELGSTPLPHNPEPSEVTVGRPMLYDAFKTSSNGEASCSSCHIFGDLDSLAWDLGDPDGDVTDNVMPLTPAPVLNPQNGGAANDEFHPMKGPMTTQTLRGMQNSGGMHWRGDRVDGFFGQDTPYVVAGNPGDESLNFDNFIVAFPGLVGGTLPPTDAGLQADMFDFTDFALEIVLPPNPIRNLNNADTAAQAAGRALYFGRNTDVVANCNGCHDLSAADGFFGTGGLTSFENETQMMKVPHLRNMYQKVGMFGMANVPFNLSGDGSHQGPQVRGFGFLHDGSTDTAFRFFTADVFANLPGFFGFQNGAAGTTERRNMEDFMLAFDSDLAPIVGQQITDDGSVNIDKTLRINLLEQRAGAAFTSKLLGGATTECELIAKANLAGEQRGFLYDPGPNTYTPDRQGEAALSEATMEGIANVVGQYVTYTCVPPGSGVRMGIDRDLDGRFDQDEIDDGTDPGNPGNLVGACNDGIDNDGDGNIDLADGGCANAGSDNENPQCDDGVDNDTDGLVDLADGKCQSASDNDEKNNPGCGLGFEAALALLPLMGLRGMRRRQGRA